MSYLSSRIARFLFVLVFSHSASPTGALAHACKPEIVQIKIVFVSKMQIGYLGGIGLENKKMSA